MQNEERWRKLCAQAAKETDPARLMELVKEINELLSEKEARLKENRARNDYKETDST
jgi:hypothetical protein